MTLQTIILGTIACLAFYIWGRFNGIKVGMDKMARLYHDKTD